MSEEAAPEAPDASAGSPEEAARETPSGDEQPPKATETVDFWKSKAREQEKRAKDNAVKAKRLDELEAANKSEFERLQAERDAALKAASDHETRASAAEMAALRQRIAIEEGLPPKFASRLTGDSEDELRADAKDTFGEFITTPSFDHGPRGKAAPQSMNDLIFGAAKRR